MKTYFLLISIFAICVIQGILTEHGSKCNSSCFEGCSVGICKKTISCMGCSRKYYEDKEKAKKTIKLMKAKDDEKIDEMTLTYKQALKELLLKHEKEINELVESQKSLYSTLVNELDEELKRIMEAQKVKLMKMKSRQETEIKELKEKQSTEIENLKKEHEEKINKTKVVLKDIREKKEKQLETICRGIDCPCCAKNGWEINCNIDC
jgi:hypothetical protein